MTRYNRNVRRQPEPVQTHEGAAAFRPPVLTELAFTAACTYANEDTFYETGDRRRERLVQLVHDACERDPAGVAWFVKDLRDRFKIRGAAVLVAAEYAAWARKSGYHNGSSASRPLPVADVVDSALQRADEPAELVAYWQGAYGRSLPAGVKKGLARAVTRLYDERSVLKWDSKDRQVRMADVVELVHPKATDVRQSALFRYLLDERHHGDGVERIEDSGLLPLVLRSYMIGQTAEQMRRLNMREFGYDWLAAGGYTWERLSGWLPGGMDAEAWEAVIPYMGVMALLRNLRNFDRAGISETAVDRVIAKITNPADVTGSRIMPYRVWTAYHNAPSDDWKRALNKTLELASGNVPGIDRSLIVVDISWSMLDRVSRRSDVDRATLAGLQALTLARRSTNADVVMFAEESGRLDDLAPGWRLWSPLHSADAVSELVKRQPLGGGTWGNTAVARHFDPQRHDHVVLFTDGQMHDNASLIAHVPSVITFNVGGYVPVSNWGRGRINVAGYSDQVFTVVAELLAQRS